MLELKSRVEGIAGRVPENETEYTHEYYTYEEREETVRVG